MPYKIKLDIFEGPLDLLLHLIKENEVDIYDIPISLITEQYLEYMTVMQNLNLELAGEYLLMAATLTYLKSKELLPKDEVEEEDDEFDGVDPREELVQRLIEYKKFKEASLKLRERELDQSQVFTRIPHEDETPSEADLLLDVSVFALLKSFRKILDRIGDRAAAYTVTLEEISVTDKITEIMGRLEKSDHLTFDSLFEGVKARMELIATFLATLELLRLRLIKAHQGRVGREIFLYRAEESDGDQISEREESSLLADFTSDCDSSGDSLSTGDSADDSSSGTPSATESEQNQTSGE